MIKPLVLFVLTSVALSTWPAALAPDGHADGILVLQSSASHVFAREVTFSLQASSEFEITRIHLLFRSAGEERARLVAIEEQPSREIAIAYVYDVQQRPVAPFTTVWYWWQVEDAGGNTVTTEKQQFEYLDNRFVWEEVSAAGTTVRWVSEQGSLSLAQEVLDTARASAEQISAELRVPVPDKMVIYVYGSQQDLKEAMVLANREWLAGQAHPDLGVVVVAVARDPGFRSHIQRSIPHEVSHLLVYHAVGPGGYRYVPEWLDEGLAAANEMLPTPDYATVLESARVRGQLVPLEALCDPFPPEADTAFLSYAQSASLVQYVRHRYGASGIRALLASYANGASCAAGIREALGTSLQGLETAWVTSLEPSSVWRQLVGKTGIWVGLWLLSLLVAVPMIGGLRRRDR